MGGGGASQQEAPVRCPYLVAGVLSPSPVLGGGVPHTDSHRHLSPKIAGSHLPLAQLRPLSPRATEQGRVGPGFYWAASCHQAVPSGWGRVRAGPGADNTQDTLGSLSHQALPPIMAQTALTPLPWTEGAWPNPLSGPRPGLPHFLTLLTWTALQLWHPDPQLGALQGQGQGRWDGRARIGVGLLVWLLPPVKAQPKFPGVGRGT